jgi:ATPase subunit of ABC transporter with duplicated ATPase domains
LDEPGNHLDLPTLLWLESFLQTWQGSFVLVSHDNTLLDAVTNASWILRDQTLHSFALPCSAARQALQEQDESAALRHKAEQKEIDRVSASARRLATWGRVYDNEDLARKAKQMEKQVARLKDEQTELSVGPPWRLVLQGTPCRPTACWRWTPCPSRPRRACHPSSPPAWRACAAAIAWPSWGATAAVNRPCCACCGSR